MRMMFIAIIAVILSANYYVLYRIWHMIPPVAPWRTLFLVCGIIVVLSPFVAVLIGGRLPFPVTSVLYRAGTSWLIILVYLFLIFFLFDLLRLTRLFPAERILHDSPVALSVLAVSVTALMIFGNLRYRTKERVDLPLTINKEFAASDPLKIVVISDLHLGYGIGKDELEKWVGLVNAEAPDVVLIAGDVPDNNVQLLYRQGMAEVFGRIRARYGVYAAPGNHEYISGIRESIDFFRDSGIVPLRDSSVLVDGRFYIIGRDDSSNRQRKPIDELLSSLDRSKPLIMMDHQPHDLHGTETNGIDLQISGHTHHGQVWPISLLTDIIFEKSYGYLKKGNSHIYVSSGLGIWGGKFRIGTKSEYAVIRLGRE